MPRACVIVSYLYAPPKAAHPKNATLKQYTRRFCLFLLASACLSAGAQKQPAALARPKLVVGIVIDQMRWDYIYRYYDRYGEGGFRRMLSQGFTCENTYIDYIPTVTAIGHSSIYTGSVPALHGMAGNDFIVNATGKSVYCTDDSTVQSVGSNSVEGRMSPRNLLTTTIGDELRLATNFQSKVIGIALKDRASILPAGHVANAAYWFDNQSGNWISSTYYMKQLPSWVDDFNKRREADKFLAQGWNTLYPVSTYAESDPDDSRYEGRFPGAAKSTFPVKFTGTKNYELVRSTPFGNTMTLDLAMAAVENEKLGMGTHTDFLAVSCSSTDYIGHKFGVNAVEVEDTYLRLDRDLAAFFNFLDRKLGKGNYTVFLSADHGAAHNAWWLSDHNVPAGFWSSGATLRALNADLDSVFHVKNLVISLSNYQVHTSWDLIAKNKIDEEALSRECLRFLNRQPGIAFAIDAKNINGSPGPAEIKQRVLNGYNPARSGSIAIILQPGLYGGEPNGTGTTHGTWNPYDAHIPLVWMGWGITHGSTFRETHMTDIAATLAALLHIQVPNGCIGHAITEVMGK